MNRIEQLRAKIAQDQFEFSQHPTDQSILQQIIESGTERSAWSVV